MEPQSKLTLVKQHLERAKKKPNQLTAFNSHLHTKYSLDAIKEKEHINKKSSASETY
jgi:hypothetical protein